MKFKVFDVVELNNGNKATILFADKEQYKAEIVTANGEAERIVDLEEKDIKRAIFKK